MADFGITRPQSFRSGTQRVGLIAGPVLFVFALVWSDIPGFHAQAAVALDLPFDHVDVVRVAHGAKATLALTLHMIAWWVTEAVPIPITALLPGLLLSLLGVVGIRDGQVYPFTNTVAFSGYANPVIYLFLAGFLLAAGMRKSGLDRRITLTFLSWKYAARNPAALLLTVMGTTAFLSMWISNTATAAMMLPIAVGILDTLGEQPGGSRMGSAMMLGVAWSASIGGIGTLIGSPPNGIVAGILSAQNISDIGFLRWMTLGLPVAATGLLAAWGVLLVTFRPRVRVSDAARANLREQRRALGAWSRDEICVLLVFLLVVSLWLTQPAWDYVLPSSVARVLSRFGVYEIGLACATLLFVVPVERRSWRSVLQWRDSHYVDWGTLILFGGGIALSNAMFATGLTNWFADGLIRSMGWATPAACLIMVVLLIDFLTEITSNTAVATMISPILIALAPQLRQDPTILCVVAAMASSMAFMLPVATPPNALVYATGYFRISQMATAGFVMNLVGCTILVAITYLVAALSSW